MSNPEPSMPPPWLKAPLPRTVYEIKIRPTSPVDRTQPRRYEVTIENATTRERCGMCRGTGSKLASPKPGQRGDCEHCSGEGFRQHLEPLMLASYTEPHVAKAYRKAVHQALNDDEMLPSMAILYAQQKAIEETREPLETNDHDEHFLPA